MKKKIFRASMVFSFLIIIIAACFLNYDMRVNSHNVKSEQIIAANEVEQLIRSDNIEKAAEKASELKENIRRSDT